MCQTLRRSQPDRQRQSLDVSNFMNDSIFTHYFSNSTQASLDTLWTCLLTVLILILISLTIFGNLVVAIAVLTVRKLRHPYNFLIVSLAMADLSVGVLVMPPAGAYFILKSWNFGQLLCVFWTSSDVLLCTASILNLGAISIDRYLVITQPLKYVPKRTSRRILKYIGIAWLLAFLISVGPIVTLHFVARENPTNSKKACQVNQSIGYQIYATLGAFYIPVIVMLFVNWKIFRAAKRLTLADKKRGARLQRSTLELDSDSFSNSKNAPISLNSEVSLRFVNAKSPTDASPQCDNLMIQCLRRAYCVWSNIGTKGQASLFRETRAAKTISVIMGVFIICWLPFFILALVKPFCARKCPIPNWLDELVTWLGYINSVINPPLYALLNRDFRLPMKEIILCRCSTLKTVLRSETFLAIYGDANAMSPSTAFTPDNPNENTSFG